MLICVFRANSASRSSSDKAELNEEGFDDVLYRACLFARCGGKRFKPEVLEVRYREKNIDDLLNMSVDEAVDFFSEGK